MSSSPDRNIQAGWIWWTPDTNTESPVLKILDPLDGRESSFLLKKLAEVVDKSKQLGFFNSLGRRVVGGPVPEFLIRTPNQTLFKASVDLIEGVPVIFDLERSGGNATTAAISRSRQDVKQRRDDVEAVSALARQNPYLVVAAQDQLAPSAKRHRTKSARVGFDWHSLYNDGEALQSASEVRSLYNDFGAKLDQMLFRSDDLAEAHDAATELSEAAMAFGRKFWSTNGAVVPLLGTLFGKLTPSQLKWTRARSATAASGLLVANSLLEDLPMEADSQPYGLLLDTTDLKARNVWLAQVAGICEAQTQLGIVPGTGIDPDVMRQLIVAKEGPGIELISDVVAVKVAAQLSDLTLVPATGTPSMFG